jgi:hypothetical protein
MQYLLMCCANEKGWENLAEGERSAVMEDYGRFVQSIVTSGHHRATLKLRPTATSTTLRQKDGRLVSTDGPFAETKEQLGGVHLIEAKDLDEALAIAARIPTLRAGGAVEVRPVEPAPHG